MVPQQQQNPQLIQQFLSTVLSQRGPASLPYSEDLKWQIRNQLVSLAAEFPSLHPKTAVYTHNDGRTVNLLQADGTIPILYHSATYNIPLVIWLIDSFPNHPPLVYVNPTRDMVIKRPHPFVNPSGSVSVPYLQTWIPPTSNLLDLARHLSDHFSRDPPLYSQRRPHLSPSTSSSSISDSMTRPNVLSPSPSYGSIPPPRTYPPSPYGGRYNNNNNNISNISNSGNRPVERTEDPGEVFKRDVISKIVESVHSDIGAMRKAREGEMEGMLAVQGGLREREEQLGMGLREMQGEKEGLEHKLQMLLMNADVLEGWLRENEKGKVGAGAEDDDDVADDDLFEPIDGLSKQMLECNAADMAIEDVVYSLDKAVQEGAVPFDQYLRNVRMLSREQFFHRATAAKVRAAQMQAHIGTMAARGMPQQHAI